MKKISYISILFLLCAECIFSEEYRINSVDYNITGITKRYALEKAVDIDKNRIFTSFEELNGYVETLRQKFANLRSLSSTMVNFSYGETDEDGRTLISLRVDTVDSNHFLAVPYPKYNSNDGFIFKLKAKDTNFLGTMETLDADINFAVEPVEDTSDYETSFGINFDYDYPFKLWRFDSSWNNEAGLTYIIGKRSPEFNVSTGLTFSYPFDDFSINLTLNQQINKDYDYEKYGDELYFTEGATLSVPYEVGKIADRYDVTWEPFISYTQNIDKDGIDIKNTDLIGPTLSYGHTISAGSENWYGNFRKGATFSFNQTLGYNYGKIEYFVKNSLTMKAFTHHKRFFGASAYISGFYNMNSDTEVGAYLRGIRDSQKYADSTDDKALSTSAGFVMNFDFPIKLFETDWIAVERRIFGEDSWVAKNMAWMRYFDFELQINPFLDFALTNNTRTEKTFALKDGWYAGGIEVLVYPKKWRSFVVRASLGVDLGNKLIKKVLPDFYDDSWRTDSPWYELSIGLGLHY